MENNSMFYLKTDDNKIINEQCIRWAKKMGDCLEVCVKSDGCHYINNNEKNTHTICKLNNPISYNRLNKHFEQNKDTL